MARHITVVNEVQFRNALGSMLVVFASSVTVSSFVQSSKAFCLIEVTFLPVFAFVNAEQL